MSRRCSKKTTSDTNWEGGNECLENNIRIVSCGSLMDGRTGVDVYIAKLKMSCLLRLQKYISVYHAKFLRLLHALDVW